MTMKDSQVLKVFYENSCIDGYVTYHTVTYKVNKYRRLLLFVRCNCPRYKGEMYPLLFSKEYSLRDKRWDCAQTDLIRQVEEKTGLQYFGNAYYGLLVFKINKEE